MTIKSKKYIIQMKIDINQFINLIQLQKCDSKLPD